MLRYILIPLLAISASAYVLDGKCNKVGFFSQKDDSPTYYGCYENKAGGLTMIPLLCLNGQVFNNAVGHCVFKTQSRNFVAAADAEGTSTTEAVIVPITTPPPETTEHLVDSTVTEEEPTETSEAPVETTEHPAETTEHPEETTEHPAETTDPSETTEHPAETTEHPEETTENPAETTENPEETTENPEETTENPEETTENPEETTENPEETTENPEETTENPTETTDDSTETTDSSETTTPEPFICPTNGFFPANGDCHSFILCYTLAGKTKPVELVCEEGQKFNPCTLICDAKYNCDECKMPTKSQSDKFDCIMEGTFADQRDHSKYFECKWNENMRRFESRHHTCDENEVFHVLTGRCGDHPKLTFGRLPIGY